MSLNAKTVFALSHKYTDDSVAGAGAIKGAPCQVGDVNQTAEGGVIELKWVDNEGNEHSKEITLQNGESAYEIAKRHGFQGTEEEWLESLHVDVEVKTDTKSKYVLTITDKDGPFDTPNLRGGEEGEGTCDCEPLEFEDQDVDFSTYPWS